MKLLLFIIGLLLLKMNEERKLEKMEKSILIKAKGKKEKYRDVDNQR